MKQEHHSFLAFDSVEFSYPDSVFPVLKDLSFDLRSGWTGICGENGAGKTTLLRLAAGLLKPSRGIIKRPEQVWYCPQRTDEPPDSWEDFFFSPDNEAGRLMDILKIGYTWTERWDTLSHGERKRLQIALALWRNPAMLGIDEPANHLDRDAKALIGAALSRYGGIGLLVSHDRQLLDRLCTRCLFLQDRGRAVIRPGGVSKGLEEDQREQLEKARTRNRIQNERDRLAAEADKRRRLAESARNRLSKKRIGPQDRDARAKINLAKLSGKDAVGANLYKRIENRIDKIEASLDRAGTRHESPAGITLRGTVSQKGWIFSLEEGCLYLGEERRLCFPALVMTPQDRIALTGPNGSGKSTLIRHILQNAGIPYLYLPQEPDINESKAVLREVLGEQEKIKGEILSRFSRLGSDPRSLLQSALPSPGEVRKLLIARGVFQNPAFIVMDEPTNHLDLRSVRLLEETMKEYLGALLLVSHDEQFLAQLTEKEWRIPAGDGRLQVICRPSLARSRK
ncbi:MAG: ATP-binding cassette domain-containing protein [Treponema sp.]|nr:ATP-binding cassette domain-containing protein [Treponema sp.]